MDALTLRGIRVPEDMAVVGFGQLEIFAAAARPPPSEHGPRLEARAGGGTDALLDMVGRQGGGTGHPAAALPAGDARDLQRRDEHRTIAPCRRDETEQKRP